VCLFVYFLSVPLVTCRVVHGIGLDDNAFRENLEDPHFEAGPDDDLGEGKSYRP
jgi:hypothetical protein